MTSVRWGWGEARGGFCSALDNTHPRKGTEPVGNEESPGYPQMRLQTLAHEV